MEGIKVEIQDLIDFVEKKGNVNKALSGEKQNVREYLKHRKFFFSEDDKELILPAGSWSLQDNILTLHDTTVTS